MNWQNQLISIYLTTCDFLKQCHLYEFFRVGPNSNPSFTDAEVLTIYIFGIIQNQRTVKDIRNYTHNHLLDWFPQLPEYEGFLARLNNLNDMWPSFCEFILKDSAFHVIQDSIEKLVVVDSMPIVMSSGFRSQYSRTASDFAAQGYCSSKKLYYYGVKFHLVADYRTGTLPAPRILKTTMANVHDLTAIKEQLMKIKNAKILGDKAYASAENKKELAKIGTEIHTPVKLTKSKKKLAEDEKIYSKIVSSFRQSIEIMFGWLEEVTGIQRASKVRSKKGLFVHVFGRFSAGLFAYIFKFDANFVNS